MTQPLRTDLPADVEIEAALQRLLSLYPMCIDLGLGRVYRLLEDLDNPHLKLPPVIHVAGTNGKGSTIAFMKAILEAAGLKVHCFTSPHLVRYNERVTLAGKQIENDFLLQILEECERVNADRPITFFEITAISSFLAFSRVPADILLLETGMGGRLDATNVVPNPAATVITTISNDHAQFLGPTLPVIAGEKAGIIKERTPCVLGYQTRQGTQCGVDIVIEHKAAEKQAPVFKAGQDWAVEDTEDHIVFKGSGQELKLPLPTLTGPHQFLNAGAAVATLMQLKNQGWDIPDTAFAEGLKNADWKARLQRLSDIEDALTREMPSIYKPELWLDGGHNDSAGLALAEQARRWHNNDQVPLHLIVAMLNTKNPEEFLSGLVERAQSITFIPVPDDSNSYSPQDLKRRVTDIPPALAVETAQDWKSAVNAIIEKENQPVRILTCGSLYLAGHILRQNWDKI